MDLLGWSPKVHYNEVYCIWPVFMKEQQLLNVDTFERLAYTKK